MSTLCVKHWSYTENSALHPMQSVHGAINKWMFFPVCTEHTAEILVLYSGVYIFHRKFNFMPVSGTINPIFGLSVCLLFITTKPASKPWVLLKSTETFSKPQEQMAVAPSPSARSKAWMRPLFRVFLVWGMAFGNAEITDCCNMAFSLNVPNSPFLLSKFDFFFLPKPQAVSAIVDCIFFNSQWHSLDVDKCWFYAYFIWILGGSSGPIQLHHYNCLQAKIIIPCKPWLAKQWRHQLSTTMVISFISNNSFLLYYLDV